MNFDITENNIRVNAKHCWMCLHTQDITMHHILPQYLNPKKNVEIPLCAPCHNELHGQDMNCLQAFAYKIMKNLKEGIKRIEVLKNMIHKKKDTQEAFTVEDHLKMKEKIGR